MKCCKGILAGLSLMMAMPTIAYGAAAQPGKVSLEINGTDQTLQSVCNIGGNTYFQLRELASLMSKEMPFDVGWDASAQTILLEKGKHIRALYQRSIKQPRKRWQQKRR